MKRYLIKGALALIAGLFITSCSHETEVDFVPIQDQRTQEFDKAFKEAFTSNIAPNQDWGFSTSQFIARQAGTRKADPGDNAEWFGPNQSDYYKQMGLVAPEMVSADEERVISEWFKTHKNPQSDRINLSTFFVQQVYFGTKEYTGKDGNGADHKVIGGQHMDWLCAYDPATGGDDHMFNFNTSSPERYWTADGTYDVRTYMSKMQLMVNSSTQRFGCKESQGTDNKVYYNYVLKALEYNGKIGYYVGFDYENHGQNGDFPKDGFYDDRIIKIVPGNGLVPEGPGTEVTPPASETEHYTAKHRTTKTEYFKKRILLDYGRVFCEDLGGNYTASDRKDFDYNDVVFDAYLYKEVEYKRETVYDTYEVTVKWKGHLPKMENGNYVYNNGQLVYEENESEIEISKYTSEPEYVSGPIESPVEGSDDRATFKADICLIACGATKPVKVGSTNDANEVHKAFGGYSVDCMINTFDENTEKGGGFGYHVVAEPVGPEDYSGVFRLIDITNQVTDKNDPSIADIPIYVQWDNISATKVVAEMGAVPQKFMSRDKDNWTSERCFLGDAYPSFTNWVSRPDITFSTGADGGYLYSGYPSPNAGLPFSESLRNQTENLEVTSTTYPSEERSELVRVEYTDVMPDDFNFSTETTPGGNNQEVAPSGGSGTGKYVGTIVYTGPYSFYNNDNVTLVSSDKFENLKKGTEMRIYAEILGDGWYIDIKTEWSGEPSFQNNEAGKSINASNNLFIKDEDGDYIKLIFDDNTSDLLYKQSGLHPYAHNLKVNAITLIAPTS